MKIISDDKRSEVSIQKNDLKDPYGPYTLEAKLSHNKDIFHGINDRVQFLNFDLFVEALEVFLKKRSGEITLEMSEGGKIDIFKLNQKGDVGLRVKVCKHVLGYESQKPVQWIISGEMKLNSEFLNQLLDDFRHLQVR